MFVRLRRLGRSHTLRSIAALLMAYVVLLPVYGPLVDPSFAERLPYHKHVYPHGTVLSHVHSYQLDGPVTGATDATGVEGGVVALPFGDDGAAAAITAVLIALLAVAVAPAMFVSRVLPSALRRRGLSTSLDPPPPRWAFSASA